VRIGLSTSVIERAGSNLARYVFGLVRAIQAEPNKHEFVLFALANDAPLFDFARDGMRVVTVSERYRPAVRNILWHQAVLPRLARQFHLDVVHVPSDRRMCWTRPCVTVATVHHLAQFHRAGSYDLARLFYGCVVARRLAARQRRLIATSRTAAGDLARYFQLNGERVTVIANGIEHERFHADGALPGRVEAARRYGLQAPFFLYVARLEHPVKNHVRLIRAFERFRAQVESPWELVLAGHDAPGAGVVHDAILRSPFRRQIHAIGFVPDNLLPDLYRAAGALVFPSLYSGFGYPPLEAMACACPVLSSPRGALAEVVGDAAVIIAPEDIVSMATQLGRMATDAALRRRLRQAGLERARQFDWEGTARATLEFYERASSPGQAWGVSNCQTHVLTYYGR